jgi:hypothetical protein
MGYDRFIKIKLSFLRVGCSCSQLRIEIEKSFYFLFFGGRFFNQRGIGILNLSRILNRTSFNIIRLFRRRALLLYDGR